MKAKEEEKERKRKGYTCKWEGCGNKGGGKGNGKIGEEGEGGRVKEGEDGMEEGIEEIMVRTREGDRKGRRGKRV